MNKRLRQSDIEKLVTMKRIYLDIIIFVLGLMTMSFQFLPKIMHEVLGILLSFCVLWHLYLNRIWFKSLFRGKYTVFRTICTVVNMLLLGSATMMTICGCIISNHLFKGFFSLELQRNILIHQIHVSFPYLIMILAGLHFGIHWQGLWQRLATKPSTACRKILYNAIALSIIAVGVYGSFLNRVGDRLLMKHIFGTVAVQLPFAEYLVFLFGIFGLYTIIGFLVQKFLRNI